MSDGNYNRAFNICLFYLKNLQDINKGDNFIYHYTSPEGLKSIIENCSLWFSDYQFLNDKSELTYFKDIFITQLNNNKEKFNKNYFYTVINNYFNDDDFFNKIKDYLISFDKNKNKAYSLGNEGYNYYIASFSTCSDELSMWNYYSKTYISDGYNLKINCKKLLGNVKKQVSDFSNKYIESKDSSGELAKRTVYYGKVNYESDNQKNIAINILNEYFEISLKVDQEYFETYILQFIRELFLVFSFYQKSDKFQNESEYRIVLQLPKSVSQYSSPEETLKMQFPIKNGCFSPKLEMKFDTWKNVIELIRIGPKNKTDFEELGRRNFIDYNDLKEVKIK
ncbi:DUF2971 domain-containing protein [Clostridium neuense]|uniref:DUF2971 domain-containing protein n=1 Tax=Clostridium neuense TaxID=1728934 RepID=A0ABW8TJT9_9CLOT